MTTFSQSSSNHQGAFLGVTSVLGGLVLAVHAVACTPDLQLADEADAGREPPMEVDAGVADAADAATESPVVLATGLASPRGLAFDEDAAYVMSRPESPALSPGGSILRIDRDTAAVTTLVSASEPSHLAADEEHLYWSDSSDGWIRRVDKLGEGATKLGQAGSEVTHLAVGEGGTVAWATSAVEVRRADAQDENGVVLRRFEDAVTGLAVDGSDVVVSLASGEMWRQPLAGGDAKLLFENESFEHGFVTDGRRFYWINSFASSIRTGNLAGGATHQIVADLPDGTAHLAVSYRWVIWTDPEGGAVRRALKTGTGPVETLAANQPLPAEIRAIEGWIAWLNHADGSVLALRY